MSGTKLTHCIFVALFPALCVIGSSAQEPAPPRFSANARLVTVDVVALDRQGQPVTGMTKNDFQVTEEGKNQQIAHFEMMRAGAAQQPAPQEPGVYTNDPESEHVRGSQ